MGAVTIVKSSAPEARSVEQSIPPPVGGWNARDALASMGPTDAYHLENWYPRPSYVEMRPGSQVHASGMEPGRKTLAVYHAPDPSNDHLFCFTDQAVHFMTFGGQFGSGAPITSRTNGKHIYEMFGDGTTNWLIAVNGVDAPFYWDGVNFKLVTGLTSPSITGLTTTDIVSLAVFKQRLLFIRNNKLGFDYLPPGVAGGAATYFDLSSIATKGGYLMAIAVWTRDAGSGPDDYAVFITSEGEAIVYQGTDPNSASTWSLVGTFTIGKPIGRRCVLKYGADPLVITENGVFPLSALLASGDERQKFAVSFKIQDAFSIAALRALGEYGWMAVSYHEHDALIINVPKGEGRGSEQFVMNTISKAWCKFTGWDADSFAVFNRNLYYTKGRSVYVAWTGDLDEKIQVTATKYAGNHIRYVAKQSYQNFGSPSIKIPNMFMPILSLQATGSAHYRSGVDTDFMSRDTVDSSTVSETTSMRWNRSKWNQSKWATSTATSREWGGIAAWPGRWLSGRLEITAPHVPCKWMGSILRYIIGYGL